MARQQKVQTVKRNPSEIPVEGASAFFYFRLEIFFFCFLFFSLSLLCVSFLPVTAWMRNHVLLFSLIWAVPAPPFVNLVLPRFHALLGLRHELAPRLLPGHLGPCPHFCLFLLHEGPGAGSTAWPRPRPRDRTLRVWVTASLRRCPGARDAHRAALPPTLSSYCLIRGQLPSSTPARLLPRCNPRAPVNPGAGHLERPEVSGACFR